jgi:selenocysteine lyase/cysteine desulfurase
MLVPALREKGYDVFGDHNAETCSCITSFNSGIQDIGELRKKLDANGIVIFLREGTDGSKCIRAALHFYNTGEKISRFLDNVPKLTKQKIFTEC